MVGALIASGLILLWWEIATREEAVGPETGRLLSERLQRLESRLEDMRKDAEVAKVASQQGLGALKTELQRLDIHLMQITHQLGEKPLAVQPAEERTIAPHRFWQRLHRRAENNDISFG